MRASRSGQQSDLRLRQAGKCDPISLCCQNRRRLAWPGPGLRPNRGRGISELHRDAAICRVHVGAQRIQRGIGVHTDEVYWQSTAGNVLRVVKGSSTIEPGITPSRDIDLEWRTFDDAADQAGLSRRYGGIHFRDGDLESRRMGRQVGQVVWRKALEHFGMRVR